MSDKKSSILTPTRREFIKYSGMAAITAPYISRAWAQTTEINMLAWYGHGEPDMVAEFEEANNVKFKPKYYAGGDNMLALIAQSPPGTYDLILSDAEFEAMRPGAIVVNTGRGPTIDNRALYKALTEGHLAAAGLDDPEEEPAKKADWSPDENPLFSLPNVLVTPHAAYYSEESIQTARETAASEVARVLTQQKPRFPVNNLAQRAV